MRGWILFHQELDPSIPEVPEILRFQEAAADLGIQLSVLNPHKFELIVGRGEDGPSATRARRYHGRTSSFAAPGRKPITTPSRCSGILSAVECG